MAASYPKHDLEHIFYNQELNVNSTKTQTKNSLGTVNTEYSVYIIFNESKNICIKQYIFQRFNYHITKLYKSKTKITQ